MRRIVSVHVCGVRNTAATQCDYITTVLCDDDTVWELRSGDTTWAPLPPIPQDSEEKP